MELVAVVEFGILIEVGSDERNIDSRSLVGQGVNGKLSLGLLRFILIFVDRLSARRHNTLRRGDNSCFLVVAMATLARDCAVGDIGVLLLVGSGGIRLLFTVIIGVKGTRKPPWREGNG